MKNLHIWVGGFKSVKEFEKFIDQKKYLEAWAVYDNEPPTGDEQQDAEPSAELRCNFCKEINIDTYDEDAIIAKYYKKSALINTIAKDLRVEKSEFETLLKKKQYSGF